MGTAQFSPLKPSDDSLIHNVLSTIQRWQLQSARHRFTICNFQTPVRQTTRAIFCPAYPPSAKIRSMKDCVSPRSSKRHHDPEHQP